MKERALSSELAEIGGPSEPPATGVWIYFAQAEGGGPIKIGSAHRPYLRLGQLQVGNPNRLRLVGIMRAEDRFAEEALQCRFEAHRIRGEWFEPVPQLVELIAGLSRDWQQFLAVSR